MLYEVITPWWKETAVPDSSGPLAARSPLWPLALGAAGLLGFLADPRLGLALALVAGGSLWFAGRGSA